MILHAHAIAENRATGERRRRIDRQHCNLVSLGAEQADHRAGQGALAGTGRAGETDEVPAPAVRMGEPGDLATLFAPTLDQRQQACQGGTIAITG